jgi:hypothetical protein
MEPPAGGPRVGQIPGQSAAGVLSGKELIDGIAIQAWHLELVGAVQIRKRVLAIVSKARDHRAAPRDNLPRRSLHLLRKPRLRHQKHLAGFEVYQRHYLDNLLAAFVKTIFRSGSDCRRSLSPV